MSGGSWTIIMWRIAGINSIGTISVAANAQIYYIGTAIGIRRGIGNGSGDDILRFKVNDVKEQRSIGHQKDRPFRKRLCFPERLCFPKRYTLNKFTMQKQGCQFGMRRKRKYSLKDKFHTRGRAGAHSRRWGCGNFAAGASPRPTLTLYDIQ